MKKLTSDKKSGDLLSVKQREAHEAALRGDPPAEPGSLKEDAAKPRP